MDELITIQRRKIIVSRDFGTICQTKIEETVLDLAAEDPKKPIELWIDSGGGLINKAFMLGDLFRQVPAPIIGTAIGAAYSSALVLLQLCDVRVGWPNCCLMFHRIKTPELLVDDRILRRVKEYQEAQEEMFQYLATRSGQKLEDIVRWATEERHWTAQAALQHGFLDRIETPCTEKDLTAFLSEPKP